MTEQHFVLKPDGKIYWIEKMPEEPVIVEIVGDGGRSRRARQLRKEYNEALQSAIDNAVEVSNQEEVFATMAWRGIAPLFNEPYPLQCSVEKKFHECQAIQCYFDCFTPNNCLSHMTALVTFSQPEREETQEDEIEVLCKRHLKHMFDLETFKHKEVERLKRAFCQGAIVMKNYLTKNYESPEV